MSNKSPQSQPKTSVLFAMIYALSKIFWFLFAPLNAAIILIFAAVLCLFISKQKGGIDTLPVRAMAGRLSGYFGIASLAVLFIFAVMPTGYTLTSALESRHQTPTELPKRVAGIIVLGGLLDTNIGLNQTTPQFNTGADRLVTFANLAKRYPTAKLVYSGGTIFPNTTPEADMAADALKSIGFNPRNRLIIENESRTTLENARNTKALVAPKDDETWLLVTSAYHMPRALGAFAAQDWALTPIPTDYLAAGNPSNATWLENLALSHIAVKELVGTTLYALTNNWKPQSSSKNSDEKITQ